MSNWQPIETEHQDGRDLWAWIPKWKMQCVAWFADGQWWTPTRESGRMGIPLPTHWQPLPDPPSSEGVK